MKWRSDVTLALSRAASGQSVDARHIDSSCTRTSDGRAGAERSESVSRLGYLSSSSPPLSLSLATRDRDRDKCTHGR